MASNRCFSLVLFFLLTGLAASTFIADDVFESHGTTGRSLLQARTSCPVNFEFMNYTVITSQCKGPRYPPDLCCGAFKQFACPYFDDINDLTNDCASTMFSYINLNGNYPPGLFSNMCRDDKRGLECTAVAPSGSTDANRGQIVWVISPLLMILVCSFSLLIQLF